MSHVIEHDDGTGRSYVLYAVRVPPYEIGPFVITEQVELMK